MTCSGCRLRYIGRNSCAQLRSGGGNDAAEVSDGVAVGNQRLDDCDLADDLPGCVPGGFHVGVPGPIRTDENSHSPWTDIQSPRQIMYKLQLNPQRLSCLVELGTGVALLLAPGLAMTLIVGSSLTSG